MLQPSTPFPHPGSRGFFREAPNSILPCRVIQHRPDGLVLISIEAPGRHPLAGGMERRPGANISPADQHKGASSNRAVPLDDLAATAEAFAPAPRTARQKVRA